MISLRITSEKRDQIEKIAKLLITQNWAIDLEITDQVERLNWNGESFDSRHVYRLKAKTKSLLFPGIQEMLKERYPTDFPETYSIPIVHMDWEHAESLSKQVKKV